MEPATNPPSRLRYGVPRSVTINVDDNALKTLLHYIAPADSKIFLLEGQQGLRGELFLAELWRPDPGWQISSVGVDYRQEDSAEADDVALTVVTTFSEVVGPGPSAETSWDMDQYLQLEIRRTLAVANLRETIAPGSADSGEVNLARLHLALDAGIESVGSGTLAVDGERSPVVMKALGSHVACAFVPAGSSGGVRVTFDSRLMDVGEIALRTVTRSVRESL